MEPIDEQRDVIEYKQHCSGHQHLVVSLARFEQKLDAINEKMAVFQDHVKESVAVRDDVRDSKRFSANATKCIWILFASVIGVVVNLFFVDKR